MQQQVISDLQVYSEMFIRYLKRNNYSRETIIGYSKDLMRFGQFLEGIYKGQILLEEVGKNDILDYMDFLKESEGFKVNSILRHLSTLKSFYKFLVQEQDFCENPAMKIQTPKNYTPLPEILDIDEVKCLLEEAKNISIFYYTMFSFIYYTGTRITAARTLKKRNVSIKNQRVYFECIKGGRDLHLPLHPRLTLILENYLEQCKGNGSPYVFQSPKVTNTPISASDVRINLRKAANSAGIKKRVTPHILRHSVATHLTVLGVGQAFIAAILGHVDLRSTIRYQHLCVENLREVVVVLQ